MSRAAWRFAALGALLFAASRAWMPPPPIVAPAARADDDALLAAAAAALGLDRDDAVVQRQLLRNARFLAGDVGGTVAPDNPAALADVEGLGLEASDLVVQRRLATRLRLALARQARAGDVDDAELAAYVDRHRQRFAIPARAQVTQVFLDRARGAALEDDARRLRERLRAGAAPRGDALPIPTALPPLGAAELTGLLGAAVAEAAFAAAPGEWSAPVASPYGLHLLRVEARQPETLPPLDAIRAAARQGLYDERAAAALAAAVRELRRE